MFGAKILSRHLHTSINLTQTDCKGSATSYNGIGEFISVMAALSFTYYLKYRDNVLLKNVAERFKFVMHLLSMTVILCN